jgi:S-methylmethionine-dependent homocysteine/selenocysteine methylase
VFANNCFYLYITWVKPVLAILFNCSEPEAINRALQTIQVDRALRDNLHTRGILLGAYANRLTPVASDWSLAESTGSQPMRKDLDPQQYYNSFVATWVQDLGVQLVGGCCGTHPCLCIQADSFLLSTYCPVADSSVSSLCYRHHTGTHCASELSAP